jgi:TusE/DsrC/DsvC family sulfur relay protein
MGVSEEIPAIDDEGYLVDPADWNEKLARVMAWQENIELGDAHWVAIHFMRDFYQEHQVIPDVRFVMRHLMAAPYGGSRNLVFELFPTATSSRPARSPA